MSETILQYTGCIEARYADIAPVGDGTAEYAISDRWLVVVGIASSPPCVGFAPTEVLAQQIFAEWK